MLSIGAMAAGQHHYYSDLAREDYYLAGGEPPGGWLGKGAKALGLDGRVEREALTSLFAGFDPKGKAPLIQIQKGRPHQPGWDLTFSAPKSVSVLWSVAPSELREAIEAAHREAVKAALGYLEETAAWTRRGKGGLELDKAGLVVSTFEHGTSRAKDAQLHTHALVINVTSRQDGTFGTLRSKDLYQHKMTAGALYRAELSHRLSRLGFKLRRGEDAFELRGVPEKLIEEQSKRRAEIEAALEKTGEKGAKASARATLTTRKVKEHASRSELFLAWARTGVRHGFTSSDAVSLIRELRPRTAAAEERLIKKTVHKEAKDLSRTEAAFSERELLKNVASKLEHRGVEAKRIVEETRKTLLTSDEFVRLSPDGPYQRFTTRENHVLEQELFAHAERSKGEASRGVSDRTLEKVLQSLSEKGITFHDEQLEALLHITQGQGSISCLEGMAGTGKTTLLRAANEAWKKEGFEVLGAALAAQAARELKKGAGIESRTIESYLRRLAPSKNSALAHHGKMIARAAAGLPTWKRPKPFPLKKNTVLVIDEAGMVGTKELVTLLRHAERAGAKVVLVGDSGQLQAIDAGAPFRALVEKLGSAKLSRIVRQEEGWMRLAVKQFAEGDARSALSLYAAQERLHVKLTKEEAIRALVSKWNVDRTVDLKESLILAALREDVRELNRLAQDARREKGELRSKGAVVAGTRIFERDRVLFTENDRKLGVDNGDRGVVERIAPGILAPHLTVRLDRTDEDGKAIRLTFSPREYEDLELGYATTVHKAQGSTVQRAFVIAGGWMQDRELSYVQMSRAREVTEVFTTELDAGEDLAELSKAMSKSRPQVLAHDIEQKKKEEKQEDKEVLSHWREQTL